MNNSKKLTLVIFLMTTTVFYAQRHPDKEKIKSLKIGYITERLELTSEEAAAFWPVYNAHEKQIRELRKQEHELVNKKLGQGVNSIEAQALSEKDAAKILEDNIVLLEIKFDLESNFLEKLKTVIPSKKILVLTQVEHRFKRKLLKEYRHKKGSGKRR